MDSRAGGNNTNHGGEHQYGMDVDPDVRKGPWTMDEDIVLMNYISSHGEGVWNDIARSAGLRRTGKSCRLRWLNYLRPDVRRGNITHEEEQLIIELQSRWGNRWSRIARQMPGRTDNEIKNYWRTRIQKKPKAAAGNGNNYGSDHHHDDGGAPPAHHGAASNQMAEIGHDVEAGCSMNGGGDSLGEFSAGSSMSTVDMDLWEMEQLWSLHSLDMRQ